MNKVVAQRGDSDFLVQTDDSAEEGRGRVVSLETDKVYEEFNLQSILSRGYWEDVTDEEGAARALELAAGARA